MYDEDEFWNFEIPYGEEFMEFFDNLKNSVINNNSNHY